LKKIFLLFLLAAFIFSGCTSNSYTLTTPDWTSEQVNAYFDRQSDIFGLLAQLKTDGYRYIAIPFTALPTFDPRVLPGVTLANGGGNCAAWVKFFMAFVEHTRSADEVLELHLLKKDLSGHMISIIRIGEKYYEQSNLNLTEYASYDIIISKWKTAGYNFIDVSKRWSKLNP
jgi:hypothetical protein